MSHKATNWFSEVPANLMTSGEFRVLFFLADCHNPSRGCFPDQEFLRGKTGLSNSGLNKCLASLEEKRLIKRKQRYDAEKKKRKSTLYQLGCDHDLMADLTPQSGDSPNSTLGADLTPLCGDTYLHPSGDKPVREPVKEPCAADAAPQTTDVSSDFLKEFAAAFPRIGNLDKTEAALRQAIADGAKPEVILAGAKAYAVEQKGNQTRYITYSENWIEQKRWAQFATATKLVDPDAIHQQRAKAIREGQSWIGRHISAVDARILVARELVTADQCKAVGIRL